MKVKFWNPVKQYQIHKEEIDQAIHNVLNSGNLICPYGGYVEEFEKKFAEFVGSKHCIMTGSGSASLELAYRVLGIGPGDEVITTSHTFIATIDRIVAVGAKPVLVDIDEETGLIDPKEIEKAITSKTKAIALVHLEGKICQMDKIDEIVHKYNLFVIEDACQAIGAKVWKTDFIKCYSFYPAKILGSIGNAGAITTNDDNLAQRLRLMRSFSNIGKNPDIENTEYGGNYEPDNIQAAVLNVKVKYLQDNINRRAEIAKIYDEELKDLPIKLPLKQEGRVYQDYTLLVEDPMKLQEYLKENEIETIGVGLIPNHRYKKLELNFNLPKTDEYLRKQIRIPCSDVLEDSEVDFIISKIKEFYVK